MQGPAAHRLVARLAEQAAREAWLLPMWFMVDRALGQLEAAAGLRRPVALARRALPALQALPAQEVQEVQAAAWLAVLAVLWAAVAVLLAAVELERGQVWIGRGSVLWQVRFFRTAQFLARQMTCGQLPKPEWRNSAGNST